MQSYSKIITTLILFSSIIFNSCVILKASKDQKNLITVSNNSNNDRISETVEINWIDLHGYQNLNPKEIVVKSEMDLEIPSQVIYSGYNLPQKIIFQTDLKAKSSKNFKIVIGTPSNYKIKTYGRQVPERFDDLAWENDRVAFRVYGEALEGQKGMAKGIDFWAKRTSELIINKWYKSNNYHKDNGDGVDAYHVGMTLGAGNAEPIVDDSIIFPTNYSEYQILDQGPLRICFKLKFKPFIVGNQLISETKTISLDAGSQMNKIVNNYTNKSDLQIAVGVTKHINDGTPKVDSLDKFVAYWDKADGEIGNGFMGVGVIFPSENIINYKETSQHLLMIGKPDKNNDFIYYQGGGWSKSGNFNSEKDWFDYLKKFSSNLKEPLIVNIK